MTATRISTLDEVGDRDAPIGSRPWAVWLVRQTLLRREQLSVWQQLLDDLLAKIDKHEAWRVLGFASREGLLASLQGKRFRQRRVLNLRHDPLADAVYVGRAVASRSLAGSDFANPYRVDVDGTREEVIERYRSWLLGRPELLDRLRELRGRRLACWCAPEPCHADVLAELVDADALLDELKAAGVAVEARDGKLRLSPASSVDAALLARTRPLKAGLLAILSAQRAAGRPLEEHPLVARAIELFSARIVKVGRPSARRTVENWQDTSRRG
jgi:hypothetical protein